MSYFRAVPFKSVLALWSEVVDVGFEVEFEDVIFVDVLRLGRNGDRVAEQGKAGQRVVILRTEGKREYSYLYCYQPKPSRLIEANLSH